jgi:STE24 endopeptidase
VTGICWSDALRKLNENSLSNLTPHPLYGGFHYSHPTMLEHEQALAARLRG